MLGSLFLFVLVGVCSAQMIRQCTCPEYQQCEYRDVDSVVGCSDSCQSHVTQMGASYYAVRACITQRDAVFRQTFDCIERSFYYACAQGAPTWVPRRRTETMKIAAMNEINNILAQGGISLSEFGSVASGFGTCTLKCVEKGIGSCIKRLNCGLSLPADNVLIQQAKACAIQNGLNTAGVQSLCQCIAAAGIPQLAQICPRLIIY